MKFGVCRNVLLLTAASGALLLSDLDSAYSAERTYQFDIPAESLGQALADFSQTTEQQIIFSNEVVANKKSRGLHGRLTASEALKSLTADADLKVESSASGVLMVRQKNVQAASDDGAASIPGNEEQVVVTGTRLSKNDTVPEIRTYSHTQISDSGQPSVAAFLSSLPEVSQSPTPPFLQTGAINTVQLRGFPVGTTLVLLDGNAMPVSGFGQGAFDINNVPDGLLQRIDILPIGSSAIYGSSALAGVVNFVLRRDLDALEMSGTYSGASGYDNYRANLSFGRKFEGGDFGFGINYQGNSPLQISARPQISSGNFSQYAGIGGRDTRVPQYCSPGTVSSVNGANLPGLSSPFASVPSVVMGKPSVGDFTAGVRNVCNAQANATLDAGTWRVGGLAYGDIDITDSITAYGTLLASRLQSDVPTLGVLLSRTVPASNPYNPFGIPVVVNQRFAVQGKQRVQTDFLYSQLGVRGTLWDSWSWDLSGRLTQDSDRILQNGRVAITLLDNALASTDPTQSFNPFDVNALNQGRNFYETTRSTYHSQSADGQFVAHGPILKLPAGEAQLSVGGQFEYQNFFNQNFSVSATGPTIPIVVDATRSVWSLFAETQVPLLPSLFGDTSPFAEASAAFRLDSYSDFGTTVEPQFGLTLRPLSSVTMRASYGEAFNAPTLFNLYRSQSTIGSVIVDPKNNNASVTIPTAFGGNPKLQPETGRSLSLGMTWSPQSIPGLNVSATYWDLIETNRVSTLDVQLMLQNESLFSQFIMRNAAGQLTGISATALNFGKLSSNGADLDTDYQLDTPWGQFTPGGSATIITRFMAALLPGLPATNRLNYAVAGDAWAPQWKATARLGWKLDSISASLSGRYLGRYLDYQTPVNSNYLGNYWLMDANIKFDLGEWSVVRESGLDDAQLTVSAVNLLNRGPRYSNIYSGSFGYDPAEYDILGRVVSVNLSAKL